MSDLSKSKGHSFAMERMMAKDEEDRLERVNTKQRRGTPTVRSDSINGSCINDVTHFLTLHSYRQILFTPHSKSPMTSLIDDLFNSDMST